MKKWITFCSQTGTEIMNISKYTNKVPNIFVTNQFNKLSREVRLWLSDLDISVVELKSKPSPDEYESIMNIYKGTEAFITLHGYTRIIPKFFINHYPSIYNGHPGLISQFPELKGLDPQEKAFNFKHSLIGSVVHIVTEGVDEGPIIHAVSCNIDTDSDLDSYYRMLKDCSLKTWLEFFHNNKLIYN